MCFYLPFLFFACGDSGCTADGMGRAAVIAARRGTDRLWRGGSRQTISSTHGPHPLGERARPSVSTGREGRSALN